MSTPAIRAALERLVEALDDYDPKWDAFPEDAMTAARAALDAAPEGDVGELVVSEMVRQLHTKAATEKANCCHYSAALLTRAAALLERLAAAAPTVVPVAVSERLPGEGDCDAKGRCWLLSKVEIEWRLLNVANPGVPHLKYCFSHWLPAHAIPLPAPQGGEVEG